MNRIQNANGVTIIKKLYWLCKAMLTLTRARSRERARRAAGDWALVKAKAMLHKQYLKPTMGFV